MHGVPVFTASSTVAGPGPCVYITVHAGDHRRCLRATATSQKGVPSLLDAQVRYAPPTDRDRELMRGPLEDGAGDRETLGRVRQSYDDMVTRVGEHAIGTSTRATTTSDRPATTA